jgi:hypothetical protein
MEEGDSAVRRQYQDEQGQANEGVQWHRSHSGAS